MENFVYQLLNRNSVLSPLGGIRLAALVGGGMGVPVPNRVLNCYSLVYVIDGCGTYSDDQVKDIPVAPGDVIQIMPTTPHWYGPTSSRGWDEVFIIFEGPAFDLLFETGCMNLKGPVNRYEPITHWRDSFLTAAGHTGEGPYAGLADVLRVQKLLLDLQIAGLDDQPAEQDWLVAAKKALRECASSREAAERLGVGYEAFRKRFRQLCGMPPARYRAHKAMEKACDLLAQNHLTVREIARELQYCDEFHFSKQFNKIIGCSPSSYRARACRHQVASSNAISH
ncbi:MAG: helix-turn-helix domain-containing protein [Pseudomonadota bacterium]